MAYTNKFQVAVAVLFLAVTITPQWTEAQNTTDTVCTVPIPVVEHCFKDLNTTSMSPSKECCKDLERTSKTEVTCLCETFFANVTIGETRLRYYDISIGCGLLDKFRCDYGGKGNNRGATNKIAASMSLFALVTNLLFLIH